MSDDLLCFRVGPDTVARAYQLATDRGVDLDGLLPLLLDEAANPVLTVDADEVRALLGATDTTPAEPGPARGDQVRHRHHGSYGVVFNLDVEGSVGVQWEDANPGYYLPEELEITSRAAEVAVADELTAHDLDAGFYGDGPLTCRCGRAEPCRHCPEEA